jgi:hypothetical protein
MHVLTGVRQEGLAAVAEEDLRHLEQDEDDTLPVLCGGWVVRKWKEERGEVGGGVG